MVRAGLQLAALSSGNLPAITANIPDYLIEEVHDRQPADVHTFLVQTSILNWLTKPE